jgi:hypothetical protein
MLDFEALRTTLETDGFGSSLDALESQDQLRLRFSSVSADLPAATRGFVLVGAWLTQLAAIESDMLGIAAESSESEFERQQYFRAEKTGFGTK